MSKSRIIGKIKKKGNLIRLYDEKFELENESWKTHPDNIIIADLYLPSFNKASQEYAGIRAWWGRAAGGLGQLRERGRRELQK